MGPSLSCCRVTSDSYYQTRYAALCSKMNDMMDIFQRALQGIAGIFSTVQFAQAAQGKDNTTANTAANKISYMESVLGVCRLFCDVSQLPSKHLFYVIASNDTEVEVTTNGTTQKVKLKEGEVMTDAEGNAIRRPWIHTLAKTGSIIGRVLTTLNIFHGHTYTLSNSTLRNISIAGIVNGCITSAAFLGTAIRSAYIFAKDGMTTALEATVFHIVSCVRSIFDVVSATLYAAGINNIASAVVSMVGGVVWFASESYFYNTSY